MIDDSDGRTLHSSLDVGVRRQQITPFTARLLQASLLPGSGFQILRTSRQAKHLQRQNDLNINIGFEFDTNPYGKAVKSYERHVSGTSTAHCGVLWSPVEFLLSPRTRPRTQSLVRHIHIPTWRRFFVILDLDGEGGTWIEE